MAPLFAPPTGRPEEWGEETILPIVDAAVAKVAESGAIWAGGHTVRSKEPLFGFAVFGEVAEDALVTNAGARPGDLLAGAEGRRDQEHRQSVRHQDRR